MSKTVVWKCKPTMATTFINHLVILVFVSLINEKYLFYRHFVTNTDLLQTQKYQKVCITDPALGNPADPKALKTD
jgi:hypothetical protein